MRKLDDNELNAVAGGPVIIIEPAFKSGEDGSESAAPTTEADIASNDL